MTHHLNSPPSQHHLHPPPKLPRISNSDDDDDDDTGCVTMASPSPLLGLGLGLSSPSTPKPLFTFMQLQELEHQALIYKYMAANLPVPVHLVLPIWKSVAASSFGPYHFPSLMGYGSLCLDYRNSMEPEPGRCRRTDGKKWRCSRDVVPDHKYCERHMHRGRNRSRKPVEAGGATASPLVVEANGQAQLNNGKAVAEVVPTTMVSSGARGVLKLLPSSSTVNDNVRSGTSSRNTSVSPPRLRFSPTSVLVNENGCKTVPS